MGRKKKSFHKPSVQIETGNDKYDNQDGRIKAINTWDDIEHNSEDEYYESREKILIDDQEQDETELSEEEVLALQTDNVSSEDENQENDLMSSDDNDNHYDYEPNLQTWGSRKKNYYDADELSDFDEAKEEEEEALRLQKKNISKMSEEDFFDDDNWFGIGSASATDMDKENEKKLIERLNKEVQKMSFEKDSGETQPGVLGKDHYSDLSRTEIMEIIQDESPELVELLTEFKEQLSVLNDTLTPILEKTKNRGVSDDPAMKFLSIKYHTLLNYLTNISFYFFLKSSGIRHLRTHPVIDALVNFKTALNKLEIVESKMEGLIRVFVDKLETDDNEKADEEVDEMISEHSQKQIDLKVENIKTKKLRESMESKHQEKLNKGKENKRSIKIKLQNEFVDVKSGEEYVEDLSNTVDTLIEPEFVSFKNMKKNKRKRDSDLGDLYALDDVDADDKAQKRKSLRHHVARIDQALVKHEKAIRLGGDADIPYKDMYGSVIKPVNNRDNGDDLDDLDWNEYDKRAADSIENEYDEDEFYLAVQKTKKANKEQKELEKRQSIENNEVVYEEEMLPDGSKRQINYQILKNKGLTPLRNKDQRNPRVKHRKKYEKAKKKIKSFKRVVVRQEGSYGGEKTGIKTKLSRSIKFGD